MFSGQILIWRKQREPRLPLFYISVPKFFQPILTHGFTQGTGDRYSQREEAILHNSGAM
jgi:hypothetical protein